MTYDYCQVGTTHRDNVLGNDVPFKNPLLSYQPHNCPKYSFQIEALWIAEEREYFPKN